MNPGYYNNGYNNGGYNNGYYNNPNGYGNRMMPPQGMPNRPNVPMNNNMNGNGNNNQNPNNKQVKPVKPIKTNNNKNGNPLLPLIIAAGVLGGIVLILIILIFAGVFAKKEEPTPEPTPSTQGQIVGTAQHGYVTVPNDWINFVDPDYNDETIKQYSTPNPDSPDEPLYIVTLGYYTDDKTTSRTAAAKLAQNLKNSNCSDLKASDKKKIGEYATYQVSGVYPDGTMLMAFFFETEDGITRTIMVEGSDANNSAFNIPYSFKLNATPTNGNADNTVTVQGNSSTGIISGDDYGIADGSTVTKGDEELEEQLRSLLSSIVEGLA